MSFNPIIKLSKAGNPVKKWMKVSVIYIRDNNPRILRKIEN